jgi:hypothetical protein
MIMAHDAGSICTMKRNTHVIVPAAKFELLSGAQSLTTYQVHHSKYTPQPIPLHSSVDERATN